MLVLSGGRVICEGSAQKGRGEGGEGRRRRIVLVLMHATYYLYPTRCLLRNRY